MGHHGLFTFAKIITPIMKQIAKQNIDILGGIIMTCAQRMMRIRLMEQMEKSNRTTKEADGTMKYLDKEGNVLVKAKMVRKEG